MEEGKIIWGNYRRGSETRVYGYINANQSQVKQMEKKEEKEMNKKYDV